MTLFNALTPAQNEAPVSDDPGAQNSRHSFAIQNVAGESTGPLTRRLAAMGELLSDQHALRTRLDTVRRIHGTDTAEGDGELAKLLLGIDRRLTTGLEAITPG